MVRRCMIALLVIVMLALGIAGISPPQVQASQVEACCPARGFYKDFYSDATYSQYIGTTTLQCNGTRYTTGSTSAYYITEWFDCY